MGSSTPNVSSDGSPGLWANMYATEAYQEFQYAQMDELVRDYGPIGEFWIDIPQMLSPAFRLRLYSHLAQVQPDAVILMNPSVHEIGKLAFAAWPTDVITYETGLPTYQIHPGGVIGHQPWRTHANKRYYLPGEVCDTVNPHWFWIEGDRPKTDAELLGAALLARARGCNHLLNVSPDRHGVIPGEQVEALRRLRGHFDRVWG